MDHDETEETLRELLKEKKRQAIDRIKSTNLIEAIESIVEKSEGGRADMEGVTYTLQRSEDSRKYVKVDRHGTILFEAAIDGMPSIDIRVLRDGTWIEKAIDY